MAKPVKDNNKRQEKYLIYINIVAHLHLKRREEKRREEKRREEKRREVYQGTIPSQLLLSSRCRVQRSHWSDVFVQWVESVLSALRSLRLLEQITHLKWHSSAQFNYFFSLYWNGSWAYGRCYLSLWSLSWCGCVWAADQWAWWHSPLCRAVRSRLHCCSGDQGSGWPPSLWKVSVAGNKRGNENTVWVL